MYGNVCYKYTPSGLFTLKKMKLKLHHDVNIMRNRKEVRQRRIRRQRKTEKAQVKRRKRKAPLHPGNLSADLTTLKLDRANQRYRAAFENAERGEPQRRRMRRMRMWLPPHGAVPPGGLHQTCL